MISGKKKDAPELIFECHGKGCEYLMLFFFFIFKINTEWVAMHDKYLAEFYVAAIAKV